MSYPEHEKMAAIPEGEREAVARFLEWLDAQGYRLGVYVQNDWNLHTFVEAAIGHDPLMYAFWEIDKTKLNEEKEQMLAALRAVQPEGETL